MEKPLFLFVKRRSKIADDKETERMDFMNLKYTEDGHLELYIENNEDAIDDVMIENIDGNAYLLPSFRSIDKDNVIVYYLEKLIPLSDYLEKNILMFMESRRIVLNIIEAFIKIKDIGLKEGNVIPYLNYIYIEPKTKEVKMIYCPVFTTMKFGGITEILKDFCLSVHTNDSEILLGTLLQYMNNYEIMNLEEIRKAIENVDESISVREVEKIVEKPVERIVERVIERTVDTGQNRIITYTIVLLYAIFTLGLPYVLSMFWGKTLVTIPGVLNFFLFMLAALINLVYVQYFTKSNHSDKMVVTVQKPNDMVDTSFDYQKEKDASDVLYEESKRLKANRKKNDFRSDRLEKNRKDIYQTTLRREKDILDSTTILKEKKKTAYFLKEGRSSVMDRIYLKEDEMLLGRDETADFRMSDSAVSKKHAKIIYRNQKYYICDLASSNGTFLNNFRLEPYEEYELKSGSRVTFGDLHYFFYL